MHNKKKWKLSLNKQTLRTLDNVSLEGVVGGGLTWSKKCKKSAKVGGGGYTCKCNQDIDDVY